jgi:hypothetical protein
MTNIRVFSLGAVFFIYGSLVHLLICTAYLDTHWNANTPRSSVDILAASISISLLGGAFVTRFMLSSFQRFQSLSKSANSEANYAVFATALRGVAATALTLETFFVLAAIYLPLRFLPKGTTLLFKDFILSFIEIQTYGFIFLFFSFPLALLYGAIAGVFLNWFSRRQDHEGI